MNDDQSWKENWQKHDPFGSGKYPREEQINCYRIGNEDSPIQNVEPAAGLCIEQKKEINEKQMIAAPQAAMPNKINNVIRGLRFMPRRASIGVRAVFRSFCLMYVLAANRRP